VGTNTVGTYRSGDFKKGLKVQIDGEPYLMSEMNFRKPGKGNALYECTLKNLIRGTTLKRVFRGGDELESADIEEVPCQYLYAHRRIHRTGFHVGHDSPIAGTKLGPGVPRGDDPLAIHREQVCSRLIKWFCRR